jgi:hypothetical protein
MIHKKNDSSVFVIRLFATQLTDSGTQKDRQTEERENANMCELEKRRPIGFV